MKKYFSLVKLSHTIFALPFAIIGFFLAVQYHDHSFELSTFLLVIICMVLARSSAMAFNRYIDKDIDKMNLRTAMRELPLGLIPSQRVLVFTIVSSILFVITTYFINSLCFYLSPIALLIILGYSYTKRFTSLSHFVLGLGLSLAPIGAYIAMTAHFDLLPIIYSLVVLFWVSGFDIVYALQDDAFDKANSLFSIPVLLGRSKGIFVAILMHIITAGLIIYGGIFAHFGLWYFTGTTIFIGLLIYQHTLVKPNDLSKINLAFFTTNGFGSIVFAIFLLLELFIG